MTGKEKHRAGMFFLQISTHNTERTLKTQQEKHMNKASFSSVTPITSSQQVRTHHSIWSSTTSLQQALPWPPSEDSVLCWMSLLHLTVSSLRVRITPPLLTGLPLLAQGLVIVDAQQLFIWWNYKRTTQKNFHFVILCTP